MKWLSPDNEVAQPSDNEVATAICYVRQIVKGARGTNPIQFTEGKMNANVLHKLRLNVIFEICCLKFAA